MEGKTLYRVLIIGLLIIISTFVIALLALLIQTFNNDSGMTAGIISGVLSMFGGMVGAFGAYLVASNQMQKQFEHEKKKEEKQKTEKIAQTLKKLEMLNGDALDFVNYFEKEFSGPFSEELISRLKFREYDLQWIVNKVDSINAEMLKDSYDIDWLRFSRVLNNMYIDIIGFNHIPEEHKPYTLDELLRAVINKKEVFVSFDQYLKKHIDDVQKQIDKLN